MTVLARSQRSWSYAQRNRNISPWQYLLEASDLGVMHSETFQISTTSCVPAAGITVIRHRGSFCRACEPFAEFIGLAGLNVREDLFDYTKFYLWRYPEALVTLSVRDNVVGPDRAKTLDALMFLHNETWPLECNARHGLLFCLLTCYWNILMCTLFCYKCI